MAEKRPIKIIEGAPEWLVSFGDMMSLLLTFFILLYSMAEPENPGMVFDVVQPYKGKYLTTKPVFGFTLPRMSSSADGMLNETRGASTNEMGQPGKSPHLVLDSEGDGYHVRTVRDNLYLRLLGGVNFREGEAVLLEDARRALKEFVLPPLIDGRAKVVVTGHAAPGEAGGEGLAATESEYNLGFARARAVQAYLVANGVDPARVEVQSAGSRVVNADENTVSRRRRVDVFVSPQVVGPAAEG